jgi:hypothetical protein
MGPFATVSVTDMVSGVAEGPVMVTVPEYWPRASPCGADEMQTFAGVEPAAGVTDSQLLPDAVEADVEKLPPEGVPLNRKQIGAGGGRLV